MSVRIEKELARDLFSTKINQLDAKINEILRIWNIKSTDEFLHLTETGELVEAVPDAISMKNLIDRRRSLLEKMKAENLL